MTWALIMMICTRVCTPQYVELYESKAACEAKKPKYGWFESKDTYCAPIAK